MTTITELPAETDAYRVIHRGRNRKQFLHARRGGIGASDIAAVLGFSPWRTPHDVWLDKTGRSDPRDQTEAMEWGIALENPIAQRVQVRHGRPDSPDPIGRVLPSPGVLQSKVWPWLIATPDRALAEFAGDQLIAPLEIKTQNQYGASSWAAGAPDYYAAQNQSQQLVMWGRDVLEGNIPDPHGWISPLIGGNTMPRPIRQQFDPIFAEYMIDDVGRWWHDYVELDVEPPLTLRDDVGAKRPPIRGQVIEATAEHLAMRRERDQLQAEKSKLEKRIDEIKAQMQLDMGSAVAIVVDDPTGHGKIPIVTWDLPQAAPKMVETFDLEAFRAAHPGLAQEYITVEPKRQSRTMLFK